MNKSTCKNKIGNIGKAITNFISDIKSAEQWAKARPHRTALLPYLKLHNDNQKKLDCMYGTFTSSLFLDVIKNSNFKCK